MAEKDKGPELPPAIKKAMKEGKSLQAATVEYLEERRVYRDQLAKEALRAYDEKRKRSRTR